MMGVMTDAVVACNADRCDVTMKFCEAGIGKLENP